MAQPTDQDVADLQAKNTEAQAARAQEFAAAHGELARVPDERRDAGWQAKMSGLKAAFRTDIIKMVADHCAAEDARAVEAATKPDATNAVAQPQEDGE